MNQMLSQNHDGGLVENQVLSGDPQEAAPTPKKKK